MFSNLKKIGLCWWTIRATILYGITLGLFLSPAYAVSYTYTVLDAPGGTNGTLVYGINDRGDIVGTINDSTGGGHGFLYNNGVYTTFDVPGATFTQANGINDRGDIVGNFYDSTGGYGFLDHNGVYTTLNAPGARYTEAL